MASHSITTALSSSTTTSDHHWFDDASSANIDEPAAVDEVFKRGGRFVLEVLIHFGLEGSSCKHVCFFLTTRLGLLLGLLLGCGGFPRRLLCSRQTPERIFGLDRAPAGDLFAPGLRENEDPQTNVAPTFNGPTFNGLVEVKFEFEFGSLFQTPATVMTRRKTQESCFP